MFKMSPLTNQHPVFTGRMPFCRPIKEWHSPKNYASEILTKAAQPQLPRFALVWIRDPDNL